MSAMDSRNGGALPGSLTEQVGGMLCRRAGRRYPRPWFLRCVHIRNFFMRERIQFFPDHTRRESRRHPRLVQRDNFLLTDLPAI